MGLTGVPLVVALVAGAVIAPTDAVAATSVFDGWTCRSGWQRSSRARA